MDFSAWFRTWMARHPLKSPDGVDQARYTDEVMAKVRAAHTPSVFRVPARVWLPWPRLALAALTAAAGLLVVSGTAHRAQRQLAGAIDRDAQMIAAVDELVPISPAGNGATPEELARELEIQDLLMLAEAAPATDDAQWLDETMQLLEQLDEDLPSDVSNDASDDWLDDLKTLDESDLSASS
jgi:hypothetical protein